jgi:hypothetical protein
MNQKAGVYLQSTQKMSANYAMATGIKGMRNTIFLLFLPSISVFTLLAHLCHTMPTFML